MQKTGKGKTFSNYRSSDNLSRTARKTVMQNGLTNNAQKKTYQQKSQDKNYAQSKQKPFQYYFYSKSAYDRERLKNSKTTLDLLRRQQRQRVKLQKQILHSNRKINQNQEYSDKPFYLKYKKKNFYDEGELNQYGLLKNNKQKQLANIKNFDKVKQNIKNINLYRKTKGMVSPKKSQSNYSNSNKNTQNQLETTTQQKQYHQDHYQLGLCPVQYKKTIAGSLKQKSRSLHHLNWSKDKSKKIDNVNKIWYNNDKVNQLVNYEFQKIRKNTEEQNKLKKSHSFRSYSGHKLFPKKEHEKYPCFNELDKANKVQNKDLKLTAHRIDYNFTNFDNMQEVERPPIPKRLGTHLNYDKNQNKLKPREKYFSQSASPRKLKFGRQVISPNGHFR